MTYDPDKITPDIRAALTRIQTEVMQEWEEHVSVCIECAWLARRCHSPIERLLQTAYDTIATFYQATGSPEGGDYRLFYMEGTPVQEAMEIIKPHEQRYNHIDLIISQLEIGNYRADFGFWRVIDCDPRAGRTRIETPLVAVECDGHDYHEKTKEQAHYDKKRDRFFQREGFNVLRFTGSEIWRDPLKCAKEIDDFLANLTTKQVLAQQRKV